MTTYHIYMLLDTLLAMSDAELGETLTGGTPQEMRANLQEMKQQGKTALSAGGCDNQDSTGRCLGHNKTEAA